MSKKFKFKIGDKVKILTPMEDHLTKGTVVHVDPLCYEHYQVDDGLYNSSYEEHNLEFFVEDPPRETNRDEDKHFHRFKKVY